MSGVSIEYKGSTIATIEDTGSKTLKTQGKYCEGDILVDYVAPPTPVPTLITKQITENGTYSAEDDNADGYDEVTVDVDINQNLDAYIQGDLSDIVFNGTNVRSYAFRNVDITSISMPNVITIEAGAFYQSFLLTVVLPKGLKSIGLYGFALASALQIVDVSEVDTIPIINAKTFNGTTCIFLFRDQTQLDAYAAATNWSALASRFQIKGA